MRAWMSCPCGAQEEVRGVDTLEQLSLIRYAFWAAHQHDGTTTVRIDPAGIPVWVDEAAGPLEDGEGL